MFTPRFLTAFTALLASTSVSAAPSVIAERAVQPVNLEVYAPHVTNPSASSVWNVGETQLVQWDTSKLDDAGKNANGVIFLGYLTPNETSEHLYIGEYSISTSVYTVTMFLRVCLDEEDDG